MNNLEEAYQKTKEIEAFCLKYQYWPIKVETPSTKEEEESNKLHLWLKKKDYYTIKKKFQYRNVRNEKGTLLIDILDSLYLKYSKLSKRARPALLNIILSIKNYCETYNEWPVQIHEPKNAKEEASRRFSKWLGANYNPNSPDFKFPDLETNNGTKARAILDDLYTKYYIPTKSTKEHTINCVCKIIAYCFNYHERPIDYRTPKTEREKKSNILMNWLERAQYTSNFKYQDIMFNECLSLKDVLDFYYLLYWEKSRETMKNYYDNLRAIVKSNIYYLLFENIIKLSNAVHTSFEEYNYYMDRIKEIIKKYNIPLSIEAILEDLKKSPEEQLQIYYEKYTVYSIMNHPLSYLYHCLYGYYNIATLSLKRVRKNN